MYKKTENEPQAMLDSLIKNMLRLVVGISLHPGPNSHCGFLYYKIVFLFLWIFLHSVSLLLFSPLVKDTENTSTLPAKPNHSQSHSV